MRVVSFVKPTNLILSSRLKLDSVSRNRPARPGLSTIELRPSRASRSSLPWSFIVAQVRPCILSLISIRSEYESDS
jgi:hypothetical protein